MAAKIRCNDEVIVITGKDKGKTGKVTKVFPREHKVLVAMKWDVQEGLYRIPKGKNACWRPPYLETILHPAILHYSSRKPWQYHCMHPLRHLYFEYQNLTPWKGEHVLNRFGPRLHRFIHLLPYTLGLKRSKYLKL